ncbi:FtsK/SpoIIIE domain-containing protein [Geodermatophilus sp. SYSU D00703]
MRLRSEPSPPASRRWSLLTADATVDVEVTAADDERLGAVLPELAEVLRLPAAQLWAGSVRLGHDVPLTSPALAHGALLGLGRPGPRGGSAERSSALELHVVGGPEAGTTVPLARGRHVVGRGGEATVGLDDPDVSRRHALVDVGTGGLTVADLGSTNGSRLGDEALGVRPQPWTGGAVLRIGASALVPAVPTDTPAALQPAPGGRLRLRSSPRLATPRQQVEVRLPAPPVRAPRRPLAWAAVALPVVAGIVLAWALSTPHLLVFTALGPVVAVGTWISDRWTGRRSGGRVTAAHAVELRAAEQRVAEAVRADVLAVGAAHPDLATLATAARRRTTALWPRARDDADALTVRVGTGEGPTAVTRVHADGTREPVTAEHLPVVVELAATGGLGVSGPRSRVLGVLAGVAAQLAALHSPSDLGLALLTSEDRLPAWKWTRWLPHLADEDVQVCRPAAGGDDEGPPLRWLAAAVAPGRPAVRATAPEAHPAPPRWTVVVVDRPVGPRLAAALRAARSAGVVVLAAGPSRQRLPVAVDAVLELAGETGTSALLHRAGSARPAAVTVDHLPAPVAAALARDLAGLTPAPAEAALPRQVSLLDLPRPGLDVDGGVLRGEWSRSRDSLIATLGRTATGAASVDLCRAGPHALVAGTTGAGKSELLQTLISSLALAHPPDRCSFLLIDYKGGAAFADAGSLPHTVGLLTDLDGASTARALRSLSAELTRREILLATHGAADLAALPNSVDLARLLIVIDEFAGLAEELPSFVSGLVGIAQRGRSLGVHLVLATQRPGGVVSPEIRANCTLRICLRTTDEADSRDVLGTPAAAGLPVDVPGRGLLRTGGGAPVLFQAARTSGPTTDARPHGPRVRPWRWPSPGAAPAEEVPPSGPSGLARLATALSRHAQEAGIPLPYRPWCPALPEIVRAEDLPSGCADTGPDEAAERSRLRIGLLDRPERQVQDALVLDLGRGGSWLAVGGARSGRTTFLRTALAEAVTALPPDELHVHVLDHEGGALAAAAAGLPHTGTTVGGEDALRTVRLLDRLGLEVAARRAGTSPAPRPRLLLLVDGIEALSAQLDEAEPGRGATPLLRLLRDGAAVGLTCLLTADRAVPGGRLAGAVGTRLVLPLPDRADYAVAGIPARAVPSCRPPGRALLGEDAVECQLALPRDLPAPALYQAPAGARRPLSVPALPADPVLPAALRADGGVGLRLPVGPGGDEGAVLEVDLARAGGLLVAGPPGSGRSSALDAFARHLAATGVPVLRVARGAADLPHAEADGDTRLGSSDVAGWRSWLAALDGARGAVVVDDHGAVAESPVLAAIADTGADQVVPLVGGTAAELSAVYRGPLPALRRRRSGLLLCPAPGDADLLGIRLPRTPVPQRPGSGWLVTAGVPQRVQVARHRPAAPTASPDRAVVGAAA